MNKKLAITWIVLLAMLIHPFLNKAFAEDTSVEEVEMLSINKNILEQEKLLKEEQLSLDQLTKIDNINFNGKVLELAKEFINPEEIMQMFIKKHNKCLQELQAIYKLPTIDVLNSKTIDSYFSIIKSYIDLPPETEIEKEIYNKYYEDIHAFIYFYYTLKNTENNKEIRNKVFESENQAFKNQDIVLEEVQYMLPYTGNNLKYFADRQSKLSSRNFNLEMAKAYAINHATNPNIEEYGYIYDGGDCTNFASQIAHEGGVSFYNFAGAESTSWYHNKISTGVIPDVHVYSIAWIRANAFARFSKRLRIMNTSSTYKGIRRYLNRGDFIGADFNRDGIFDHFAFIVEYDSSRQELLFAQHSTDYLRWENNTNWPANNGSLYVRVRAGEY